MSSPDRLQGHGCLSKLDPSFEQYLPEINDSFDKIWSFRTVDELRSNFAGARLNHPPFAPTKGYVTSHQKVPLAGGTSIEIRIYRPDTAVGPLPLLYVCHGGGWTVGGHDSEGTMNTTVCVQVGIMVISVDYRRAPEHPFPTPLNDAYEIIENASKLGVDPSQIVVGGSSSGANIAAAVSLRSRDHGVSGIIGQVLNIPALCHPKHFPMLKHKLQSFTENADAPTINSARMRFFWDQYLPNADSDTYANPLLAPSVSELPSTLIQVAGLDPLRDEGIAYATALEAAGVPTTLKTFPGLPHGFIMVLALPQTFEFYQNVASWIRNLLASRLSDMDVGHVSQ